MDSPKVETKRSLKFFDKQIQNGQQRDLKKLKMIEIPKMPQLFEKGLITKDSAQELIKWGKAFEAIGCEVQFEGESSSVNLSEGTLMCVLFKSTCSTDYIIDGPFGEAYFDINNEASVQIHQVSSDYDGWMQLMKEAEAPIIINDAFNGTWEEVYKEILSYLEFVQKSIPPFPEVLL